MKFKEDNVKKGVKHSSDTGHAESIQKGNSPNRKQVTTSGSNTRNIVGLRHSQLDTTTNRSNQQQLSAKTLQSAATKSQTNNSTIDIKRRAREKQYEKIKEYAQKYNVDEAMIYALLSEYKGMLKIKVDH